MIVNETEHFRSVQAHHEKKRFILVADYIGVGTKSYVTSLKPINIFVFHLCRSWNNLSS